MIQNDIMTGHVAVASHLAIKTSVSCTRSTSTQIAYVCRVAVVPPRSGVAIVVYTVTMLARQSRLRVCWCSPPGPGPPRPGTSSDRS
ncbi:hypothetical protein EVAR_4750_1 [Eumeta japonica]|uniref:Uncharacterized protein n=1 Tax=Eumeta variegata TaxID=151549 RepID=A0A4C1SZH1_EUMVA|nr:hypothetical protein EVAR_4750_1 [Eumeta japonica]